MLRNLRLCEGTAERDHICSLLHPEQILYMYSQLPKASSTIASTWPVAVTGYFWQPQVQPRDHVAHCFVPDEHYVRATYGQMRLLIASSWMDTMYVQTVFLSFAPTVFLMS
jgi:hypothetical protein